MPKTSLPFFPAMATVQDWRSSDLECCAASPCPCFRYSSLFSNDHSNSTGHRECTCAGHLHCYVLTYPESPFWWLPPICQQSSHYPYFWCSKHQHELFSTSECDGFFVTLLGRDIVFEWFWVPWDPQTVWSMKEIIQKALSFLWVSNSISWAPVCDRVQQIYHFSTLSGFSLPNTCMCVQGPVSTLDFYRSNQTKLRISILQNLFW